MLSKFSSSIGSFSTAELNDALLTVYGEISADLHAKLKEEAEAVASTIFNRHRLIPEKRKAYADAKAAVDAVTARRKTAQLRYEDLTKNPTKYQKELGSRYVNEVASSKAAYEAATKELGTAQMKLTAANSDKIKYEAYAGANKNAATVTLTHLVSAENQYLGFAKGKQDFDGFAAMSQADQARHQKRWDTAKAAVQGLADGSITPSGYIEFRSNKSGERKLGENETRIGGNDFRK